MSETIASEVHFGQERGLDGLGESLVVVRTLYMDGEAGRAAIECQAEMRMCHSGGVVQGGFISGWIDAAMAHAAMGATMARVIVWGLIVTGWGNIIASVVSAMTGGRGLGFTGADWNTVTFTLFMAAILGVIAAMIAVAWASFKSR